VILLKRIVVLFVVLFVMFSGAWTYKLSKPLKPLNAYAYGIDAESGAWWNSGYTEPVAEVDDDWRLDPEIPENYVPVLGADELYMVIGKDGKIQGYRHRYKEADGTWVWEDVNPDIPDGWELVDGFTDLYRVIGADGSVRYYRYTRNEDDTFFFTECDSEGNPLYNNEPQGDEIPDNYVRVTGNIYAVYNEHGVLIGYKERVMNADGTYSWIVVDKPVIPERQPGTSGGGNGNSNNNQSSSNPGWVIDLQIPGFGGGGGDNEITIITDPGSTVITDPKESGGFIETETFTETETKGGYTVVYETTITKEYDKSGKLKSTKKDGPHEISRYPAVPGAGEKKDPNPARIESTIDAEYARVANGLTFDTTLASEVLAGLNAERVSQGLPPLVMSSGNLLKAACIKAADMAIYEHTDFDSPMYGDISSLLTRFNIKVNSPSETLWKTTSKDAGQINARFMAQSESYESRMSEQYSECAIAIVRQDAYIYIVEIFN
jgi:uncharacterized protein YkwD